jgi:predicted N-acetyltransferase YhbS
MPEWNQNGVCVVDVATNQIVGCNFVSVQEAGSPHVRSIGPVAVKPGFQGKGIGKKIMELAIAKARAQSATSLRFVFAPQKSWETST